MVIVVQTNSPTSNEYGMNHWNSWRGSQIGLARSAPWRAGCSRRIQGCSWGEWDINESRNFDGRHKRTQEGFSCLMTLKWKLSEQRRTSSVVSKRWSNQDEDLTRFFRPKCRWSCWYVWKCCRGRDRWRNRTRREDEEDEIIEEEAWGHEAEDDVVVVEEEEVTTQSGGAWMELFNPEMVQEPIVVHRPLEPQTQDAIPTISRRANTLLQESRVHCSRRGIGDWSNHVPYHFKTSKWELFNDHFLVFSSTIFGQYIEMMEFHEEYTSIRGYKNVDAELICVTKGQRCNGHSFQRQLFYRRRARNVACHEQCAKANHDTSTTT